MTDEQISLTGLRDVLSGIRNDKGVSFQALCPAHDDESPSLSVTEGDGLILMICHAGCSFEAVCEALDIRPKQLFTDQGTVRNKSISPESIYDYHDEHGKLIFQVIRLPGKKFRCRQPLEDGRWTNNLNGVERVLYRLPQLKEARSASTIEIQTVFICEGEKDVETLERQGLFATCNPHGAGKWRDEFSKSLAGLNCVVIPDNDDAGRKHAETVCKSIQPYAASVRVLELADLREKGDVTEWFDADHSKEEFIHLAESVEDLGTEGNERIEPKTGLHYSTLAELLGEPEEDVAYVCDGLLTRGGLSVLSAKPKVGKTTVLHSAAFTISLGLPFLGRGTFKGLVIYFCLEEKRSEVRKRFYKMGAAGDDIILCSQVNVENFEHDLRLAIAEYNPIAVFIDPMVRVVRARDFNDYAQMARALEPFIDIARRHNVLILMAHHDGKSGRVGGDGLLGSTAIFGSVDTHLQMAIKDGRRTIRSTNRYGEDLPETIISLNKETGLIETSGTVVEEVQASWDLRIIDCINFGDELTEKDIKTHVGSSPEVSRAIRKMHLAGRLLRDGKGVKGNPFRYRRPAIYDLEQNAQY